MTNILYDRPQIIKENLETNTRCHVCGHPLAGYQIAASLIDVKIIDWRAMGEATLSLHICEECWNKILSHKRDDIEGVKRGLEETK